MLYLVELQWDSHNSILYRLVKPGFEKNSLLVVLKTSGTHTFTHFIFFFLQQNNLDYVDPQIANLLFEAGQSSTKHRLQYIKKIKN